MTTIEELEHLLYVEEIHAGHFSEWEKRATDPLARMVFRLAADKEANHIRWVRLMIEIAKAKRHGRDIGVPTGDLEYWVADEDGEGEEYERLAGRAEEPWVRAALRQMGHDEATNADLLRELLTAVE